MPQEWITDVRQADEDRLLALVNHLPGEAAEAPIEVAVGERISRYLGAAGHLPAYAYG